MKIDFKKLKCLSFSFNSGFYLSHPQDFIYIDTSLTEYGQKGVHLCARCMEIVGYTFVPIERLKMKIKD